MRNQGREGMGSLGHKRLGYNYRLSDIACALGVVQVRRIREILDKRTRVANWYQERLRTEQRLRLQKIEPHNEMSWFVFVVKLDDRYTEDDRAKVMTGLCERGAHLNRSRLKNLFGPQNGESGPYLVRKTASTPAGLIQ